MRIFFLALLVAAGSVNIKAIGGDWRYYGLSSETKSGKEVTTASFYDARSVRRTPHGTTEVWIMSVDHPRLLDVINKYRSQIITETNKKIGDKYIPPYCSTRGVQDKAEKAVIVMEEVTVQSFGSFPFVLGHVELRIAAREARMLSLSRTLENGQVKSISDEPLDWIHIDANTNTDTLIEILSRR